MRKKFELTKYPRGKVWTVETLTGNNFEHTKYPREKILNSQRHDDKTRPTKPTKFNTVLKNDPNVISYINSNTVGNLKYKKDLDRELSKLI